MPNSKTRNVTIATHNGSSIAREHNRRNRKVTDKENHINPDGWHETWHDETERAAYHRIFDDAVKRYNDKQTRSDRCIKNYYKNVAEDAKKHTAYELIVGVYGKRDAKMDAATARDILHEYFTGWQQRNPNLELIGAYFHADEPGQPHIHVDYIPVAHNYTRGMDTQTAIDRALREQGFERQGKLTPQIAWERAENDTLEAICRAHGLEVEHPQRAQENIKHLQKEAYIATQQRDEAIRERDAMQQELNATQQQLNELVERIDKLARKKDVEHRRTLFKHNVVLSSEAFEDVKIALERAEVVKSLDARENAVKEREASAERIEADARKRADDIIRMADLEQQTRFAQLQSQIQNLQHRKEKLEEFVKQKNLAAEYDRFANPERYQRSTTAWKPSFEQKPGFTPTGRRKRFSNDLER